MNIYRRRTLILIYLGFYNKRTRHIRRSTNIHIVSHRCRNISRYNTSAWYPGQHQVICMTQSLTEVGGKWQCFGKNKFRPSSYYYYIGKLILYSLPSWSQLIQGWRSNFCTCYTVEPTYDLKWSYQRIHVRVSPYKDYVLYFDTSARVFLVTRHVSSWEPYKYPGPSNPVNSLLGKLRHLGPIHVSSRVQDLAHVDVIVPSTVYSSPAVWRECSMQLVKHFRP